VLPIVVPQRGQNSSRNQRPLSSERCSYDDLASPSKPTLCVSNADQTANALPVSRWQKVQ